MSGAPAVVGSFRIEAISKSCYSFLPHASIRGCIHQGESNEIFRQTGHSGLKVPVLLLRHRTFGGGNEFFQSWVRPTSQGRKLIDICVEVVSTSFDTADV